MVLERLCFLMHSDINTIIIPPRSLSYFFVVLWELGGWQCSSPFKKGIGATLTVFKPTRILWHTIIMNVWLNQSMWTISRTLRSTPLPWWSLICNFAPLSVIRECATVKCLRKCQSNMNCLLCTNFINTSRSRKPSWICLQDLSVKKVWEINWSTSGTKAPPSNLISLKTLLKG